MKLIRISLPLLCAAAFLLAGCSKEERILFEIPFQRNIEIPAGLNVFEEHNFVVSDIPVDTATLFRVRNINSNQLRTISPLSMRLTNLSSNAGYNFIEDLSVVIYHPDNPRYEIEVFYRDQVPANTGSELDLVPTLADAKPILLKNRFNVRVRFRLRQTTPEFLTTQLLIKFGAK